MSYAAHSPQVEAIEDALLKGCSGITPQTGDVPFYSAVTGGTLDTGSLDTDYWYRNLRMPVEFERATCALLEKGHRTFVEVSPHPVLTIGIGETVERVLDDPAEVGVVGSLRREEGGSDRFALSLAEAFVRGVEVDWSAVIDGHARSRMRLPSYAFQRKRYWFEASMGMEDTSSAGYGSVDHPFLSSAVRLAGNRGWMFAGRVSLQTHPWLADHVVMGVTILPGTAFLELALGVGEEVGAEVVSELVLESPLVLDERTVQVQICVGEPDEQGESSIGIYSRTAEAGEAAEQEWRSHASGALIRADAHCRAQAHASSAVNGKAWPPEGAEAAKVEEDFYKHGGELGVDFGPAFQGLKAAWRSGEEIFAEVALSEDEKTQASSFGLHPALLDATLHTVGLLNRWFEGENGDGDGRRLRLPFAWRGVQLSAAGSSELRAGLRREAEGTVSLTVADAAGETVASIDSLVFRELSEAQLRSVGGRLRNLLFGLDWTTVAVDTAGLPSPGQWTLLGEPDTELAALSAAGGDVTVLADMHSLGQVLGEGAPIPKVVLLDCMSLRGGADSAASDDPQPIDGPELAEQAHRMTHRVLEVMQDWLSDERLLSSRLVLVTRNAVAVDRGEDVPEMAQAPIWGLVRSAQSENPGCFALIDLDGEGASWSALGAAIASDESQLAIRGGNLLAPGLVPVAAGERSEREDTTEESSWAFDPGGSVLISGGTGDLGGLVARDLVDRHGVRSLILLGRRGPDAPGMKQLVAELAELGASVRVLSCDVADGAQLSAVLDSIPSEYPLRGIVHAAATLEDGVIGSLTQEQVDRVLAPKLDGAWNLHLQTRHLDISAFVLFSSVMGILGGPGQANYASANTFLDALAAHRRAQGLPGASMAWGGWAQTGIVDRLGEADLARSVRLGIGGLSNQEGLDLLAAAGMADRALLVPMRLDTAALRAQARAGAVSPLLRKSIRVSSRDARGGGELLARRLVGAPPQEREGVLLEAVRAEVAIVLGHPSPLTVNPKSSFKQLGFDSLGAVELRNRLNVLTGLRLPSTLVFDYPTPTVVASYISSQLSIGERGLDTEEAEIRAALASVPIARIRELGLVDALLGLGRPTSQGESTGGEQPKPIDTMDVQELVAKAMKRADPLVVAEEGSS